MLQPCVVLSPKLISFLKKLVNNIFPHQQKGQVSSNDLLKTIYPIDFIYEGYKYKFTAAKFANETYTLFINASKVEVGAKPLFDGSLLVALAGKSHTVYWKEQVGATRLSVDFKNC